MERSFTRFFVNNILLNKMTMGPLYVQDLTVFLFRKNISSCEVVITAFITAINF